MMSAGARRPLWLPEAVMAMRSPVSRAEKLPLVAGTQPRASNAAPTATS
jgi:hypothetical protein